jgi:hypothetical protein
VPGLHILRFAPASVDALRAEIATNLGRGRIFVSGVPTVQVRDACELCIVHPTTGAELRLEAEAVWVKADEPGAGVGLELRLGTDAAQRLAEFPDATADEERVSRNVYERVRSLSSRERELMARQGSLMERVALERTYGSSVWEGLLSNPQLTPPEVMRIAKNGTLPQPLAGAIVSNAGWLAQPEVQRALLGNPRVTGAHLDRVLRAMSRTDLLRLVQTGANRSAVRTAAKKILGI